ncbi:MAG: hypothetical protein QOE23_570 [Pseudonocardiales bacterium]|jgi:hypothetical protein|nr:hypothetical protein [Pseudonocardiales bacterium]
MESRHAYTDEPFEPPHGTVETGIARIWQSTLNVGPVGRSDNFIELGGSSIRAAQCCQRLMAELGASATVEKLMRSDDLAAFARALYE